MKLGCPRLCLLVALGLMPGTASYGLMDRSDAEGPGRELILMQQQRMRTMPTFDPAANRQAVQDRCNQEVLNALSRPPTGWVHYDHPPVQGAAAASSALPAEPSSNLWNKVLWVLVLGGGVVFVAAQFMPQRAPAPSRKPKDQASTQDDPYHVDD
ncbi:MAG: hypothetical protein NTY53_21870 [Kiritimatiellaeota bacterium]|nr:hypothetical protein [Kiritimatiellota bacterium]